MTRVDVNGIHLDVTLRGAGPAVLLLHGFTGSGAAWIPPIGLWPAFTTVAVDLLGHGGSSIPAEPNRYRMARCVEDLVALLDRLGIGHTAVLGYSMGARVALQLALAAPQRLWALVLESASPGIADLSERNARARADAALAETIERDGVEAFVDRWEALPLFATQRRLRPDVRAGLRRQRLQNDPQGLANSLRGLGVGSQEPLGDRLAEIRIPALLIAGAEDEKYSALARGLAAALPHARLAIVADAGHAVHLEQPATFSRTVEGFLDGCVQREERRNAKCR